MDNSSHEPKTAEAIKEAQKAIKKKMFSYIAAGFGLVAGLAWNEAIKGIIDYFLPNTASTIVAKLIYAVIITIVVGIMIFSIEKSLSDDSK